MADEISLAWPPPSQKRRVGAPTRQSLWTSRLYATLFENRFALVRSAGSATVPGWWSKGMPLDGPPKAAVASAAAYLPSSAAATAQMQTSYKLSEQRLWKAVTMIRPSWANGQQQPQQQQHQQRAQRQLVPKQHRSAGRTKTNFRPPGGPGVVLEVGTPYAHTS